MATPLVIETMLKCYFLAGSIIPRSPAQVEALELLEKEGMVVLQKDSTDCFDATVKGTLYVEALMKVPFPVAKWFIPTRPEMSS